MKTLINPLFGQDNEKPNPNAALGLNEDEVDLICKSASWKEDSATGNLPAIEENLAKENVARLTKEWNERYSKIVCPPVDGYNGSFETSYIFKRLVSSGGEL